MTKAMMTTEAEVDAFQVETAAVVVVADRFNELFLVFISSDERLCYQGVPQALSEHGRRFDRNSGRVSDLLADRGARVRVWPVAS